MGLDFIKLISSKIKSGNIKYSYMTQRKIELHNRKRMFDFVERTRTFKTKDLELIKGLLSNAFFI